MTEQSVLNYLVANWPGLSLQIGAFLILLRAYLKLRSFVERFAKLERKVGRIFQVCLEQHKDKAIDLLSDEDDKEN